uniref:Uncharacterized protein n=1 Tax=Kalanchoe fedtschenkoi TaxID=63787 RepID=A0A7N0UN45_KALFE
MRDGRKLSNWKKGKGAPFFLCRSLLFSFWGLRKVFDKEYGGRVGSYYFNTGNLFYCKARPSGGYLAKPGKTTGGRLSNCI